MATDSPRPEAENPAQQAKSEELRKLRRIGRVTILFGALMLFLGGAQIKAYNDQDNSNERIADQAKVIKSTQRCNIKFAVALSETLRERDALTNTSRASQIELWKKIKDLVKNPGQTGQQQFNDIINEHIHNLERLDEASVNNPYPKLRPCLKRAAAKADDEAIRGVLRLVSSSAPALLAGPGFPGKWDDHCLHRKVTMRGTDEGDVITGTPGRDVIFAYSGNDLVDAGPGRDRVCGRFGGDILNGGADFDRVNGGNGGGTDLCFGERTKKCP
jgi:predicted DNA-binding protein YlxM (UPF0122 family)